MCNVLYGNKSSFDEYKLVNLKCFVCKKQVSINLLQMRKGFVVQQSTYTVNGYVYIERLRCT